MTIHRNPAPKRGGLCGGRLAGFAQPKMAGLTLPTATRWLLR